MLTTILAAATLVVGQSPALAHSPGSAAAIASIRSASSSSLSPEGRRVAYITNVSGSPQVWTAPVDGSSAPTQVTRLSDPVQSVRWSLAGDWLAYDVAPGGGLNVQVYIAHPDGSEARLVTAGGQVNNRLDD